MRSMKMVVALCLLALGTQAQASSAVGYVRQVGYSGSRVFVWIDAPRDGPSCNTPGAADRYELDGGTAAGQTQLSIILTALALRRTLLVSGTNSCPNDTETIGYVESRP